jgi:quinolinate synthase
LRKVNPAVDFVPITERSVCPNMKRMTVEKVLWALEKMEPRIEIPEETRRRARTAVERMLALGKSP